MTAGERFYSVSPSFISAFSPFLKFLRKKIKKGKKIFK